jgi:hypothetical protein
MSAEEAMTELRLSATNGQLDGELVESFIGLLEREGAALAQDADFETELEFDRRVRDMAEPKPKTSSGGQLSRAPDKSTTLRSG